jgi:poly(3-hydroxybutyrate) depolymerase
MLFLKKFSILILFIVLGSCLPTSKEKESNTKQSAIPQEESASIVNMLQRPGGPRPPVNPLKQKPGMPSREMPARSSAGAKKEPDCIDASERSLSRVLDFKNCSYVIKHIGLAGVAHNAGSSVMFDGKKNANHFLLKSLGVYDIEPVEKDEESNSESLELDDDGTTTFKIDGNVLNVNEENVTVQREFIVHVPDDYDKNFEYAVVFAFHGHGGNSTQWADSLGDLINEYKFIGVYPKGYQDPEAKDDHGNAAQTSWNLGKETSTADDIVFVNDIIKKLEPISSDPSKRFALGSSNGAALSHFVAANAKTKIFNGIGTLVSGLIKTTLEEKTEITIPVSGNTYHYGLSEDSIPLNVVTIFGMSDPIIPYCGGEAKTGTINYSAEETIREWAKLAGCSDYSSKKVETFESNSTSEIDLSQY